MPYITSEKVKAIRDEIKKTFPAYKFSVTREHSSTVNVSVLSGPYEEVPEKVMKQLKEIVNRDCKDIYEDADYGWIPNFYTRVAVGRWDHPYKMIESKFVSNLPESTPELDGLRKLKNDMAVAKLNFENRKGMKKINARFGSKCAETGLYISKGEEMYYDYSAKKCYSSKSEMFKKLEEPADPGLAAMIQANEDAEFDRFTQMQNYQYN